MTAPNHLATNGVVRFGILAGRRRSRRAEKSEFDPSLFWGRFTSAKIAAEWGALLTFRMSSSGPECIPPLLS